MLRKDGLDIKLTDFGFAVCTPDVHKLQEELGSRWYMAPEILAKQEYNEKVDVWSAGVVAHLLLIGEPPFPGDTKEEVYKMIRTNEINYNGEEYIHLSDQAKDFLSKTLQKMPGERHTSAQLLNH